MISKKEKARLYRIHRNLARYGNLVNARKRTVVLRDSQLTNKEEKWLVELAKFGYAICNDMFGWN